jgi:hypothetical protein
MPWSPGDRAGEGQAYGDLGRALLLALTELLDRIVTRRHRRASRIECMRRQSGSRLPSMVVVHLQTYCSAGGQRSLPRRKDPEA